MKHNLDEIGKFAIQMKEYKMLDEELDIYDFYTEEYIRKYRFWYSTALKPNFYNTRREALISMYNQLRNDKIYTERDRKSFFKSFKDYLEDLSEHII